MQGVPVAYFWQAPASHLPLVPQVEAALIRAQAGRIERPVGDVACTCRARRRRTTGRRRCRPCRSRRPARRTCSCTRLRAEHDAPLSFRPHEFAAHVFGVRHWLLLVQALKQREPLQT